MKTGKKIISVVLAIAMVVTTLMFVPKTNVSAAVKLLYPKNKKITLEVGENDFIIVKQKGAVLSSSNANIAKVDKKAKLIEGNYSAKVVAKKVGKCKITVKIGKKKKKVTITVIPSTPTMKSVYTVGSNSATSSAQIATIKANWKKVKGAAGYVMYYSSNKDSGYKSVTVKGESTTSGTASGLVYGNTYYVKVKAFAKYKGKNVFCDDYSGVKSVKTYMMKWNDEFNGTALDNTKWHNEDATGDGGYGNYELQDYQIDYCKVEDGKFVIMPQFDWNVDTKKYVEKSAFSTKVWTRPDEETNNPGYTVKYGKIEFRAKLPKGDGTWAACWMLGMLDGSNEDARYKWPDCGEIDVLETTYAKAKTTIPQTIHCKKFNGMSTSSGPKHVDSIIPTATSAYHTYCVQWSSTKLDFYIDGVYRGSYNPSDYILTGNPWAGNDVWPYKRPFYLILNCAIGGLLGVDSNGRQGNVSEVNPDGWTLIGTKTNEQGQTIETYQDYMYIDYVRVYQ